MLQRRAMQKEVAWKITHRTKLAAISVYVQSGYSEEATLEYLSFKQRVDRQNLTARTGDKQLDIPMLDWFTQMPLDDIHRVTHSPVTSWEYRIMHEAHKFLVERTTYGWLATQNFEAGKTVSSIQLVRHYLQALKGDAAKNDSDAFFDVRPGGRGLKVTSTMRRWCCRFKKKWRVRHGKICEREQMEPDEVKSKVP